MKLIVIAKEPVPGRVKTRLTPPYSRDEAAALAAAALADTLDVVVAACRSRHLDTAHPLVVLDGEPGPWLPAGVPVAGQSTGPFDERLAAAFDGVRGEPALLIGMDTPQVRVDLLVAACLALREADAVFGRAVDGGWWALGLRWADGRMVRGIPTSRPDTGALQHARLRAANLNVAELPVLRDVDTVADVEPVATLVPGGRFAAVVRSRREPTPDEFLRNPSGPRGRNPATDDHRGPAVGRARTVPDVAVPDVAVPAQAGR